jgi:hypothetical protein
MISHSGIDIKTTHYYNGSSDESWAMKAILTQ